MVHVWSMWSLVLFIFVFCDQKVHIEFTEGEDKITLEGPTKDVQLVQSQIEATVTDLVYITVIYRVVLMCANHK